MVRAECELEIRNDELRPHPGPDRQPPQTRSLSAAALDIPKFVPKVDLQADYNTAKVRGGPQVAGRGWLMQGFGVRDLTLPTSVSQGVLGAGYQALRLAQALLAGQELMLRGLHWFV